jgi:hypothetical protein
VWSSLAERRIEKACLREARCGRGGAASCPLSEAKYVWALVRWGRAGVRSTEFGGVLSSEVSMY